MMEAETWMDQSEALDWVFKPSYNTIGSVCSPTTHLKQFDIGVGSSHA